MHYILNIKTSLPDNKKCFPEGCRWVDYYNYSVALSTQKSENDLIPAHLVPVFCRNFLDVNKYLFSKHHNQISSEYYKCALKTGNRFYYGKKVTDKFFVKVTHTFKNIDDVFAYNTLNIYDAQKETVRERQNSAHSTEGLDVFEVPTKEPVFKKINLIYKEINK